MGAAVRCRRASTGVHMAYASQPSSNAAQIEDWNAALGRTWTQFQEQLERQLDPLGQETIRALAPVPGEHILDIGCGCGATTLDLAVRVGRGGSVVGVDVSVPMLDVARQRSRPADAGPAEFLQLDAQHDTLGSAFDAAFSRFGVMFFSDPVAAFRNILTSLKHDGRLVFVCWRRLEENPWVRVPLEAAWPFLPGAAPADPTAPGPFAFAEASRVRSILIDAGFASVAATPFDSLIGGADLEQTLKLALRVGPLGAALREHPELEPRVIGPVREALRNYLTAAGVRMPSATWIMSARRD
jgi:SAM-dependent methyltransferase